MEYWRGKTDVTKTLDMVASVRILLIGMDVCLCFFFFLFMSFVGVEALRRADTSACRKCYGISNHRFKVVGGTGCSTMQWTIETLPTVFCFFSIKCHSFRSWASMGRRGWRNLFKRGRIGPLSYAGEPGYNDIGLYDTSFIASDIMWCQLIPHW
jgi:hypothetical protein